ncbi:hypothetical protein [Actinosynnema mirum]|uniref:Uncharacterized protein n=1 Tax=Actinosynnema mirum (strain ATCC 29888 / DSM 43827 / JCM 3225 / NBRC 14064 / NCIMB 13271 / NRRL B-12336 / IMRU 3971 / 101) TaxID=446462 RepID=C6WB88_ACTMD|nr:hypothetical protein [Actinosynnema mirum]ACU39379.1 hypothetical protein Amir_5561 [Actinosynnema mirum DSM 43827]
MSTAPIAVHFFEEDGFLVRGTLDPREALRLAVAHDEDFEIAYQTAAEAGRDPDRPGATPLPATVDELADLCHDLLAEARPGLYRIVPARPNNHGYSWFCHTARERGLGVFEGVMFR